MYCLCDLAESSDDCEEDSHLLSPTSWFPATAKSDSTVPTETSGTSSDGDLKASSSTTCPLAGLLPPEYANIDVTQLFPDFRPGQVRYFLAILFRHMYLVFCLFDVFNCINFNSFSQMIYLIVMCRKCIESFA